MSIIDKIDETKFWNSKNVLVTGGSGFFGSGVVTSDKLRIGKWSHIGAGSIITKNMPENTQHFAASGKLKTF